MKKICYVCYSSNLKSLFKYNRPAIFLTESDKILPKNIKSTNIKKEIVFSQLINKNYKREILYCQYCYHHQEDFNYFFDYSKDYLDKAYGNLDGLKKTFNKIIKLPIEKSDNKQRVQFIVNFFKKYSTVNNNRFKVLDIGIGLGVFLYELKKRNWSTLGIDLDQRYIDHANNILNIKSYCTDFSKLNVRSNFDLITLNKVLEHLKNPKKLLKKISTFMTKKTFLYLEIPDPISAKKLGKNREEFLMGHINIFSHISISMLLEELNFNLIILNRIREPSGKFTMRIIANLK